MAQEFDLRTVLKRGKALKLYHGIIVGVFSCRFGHALYLTIISTFFR